MEALKIQTVIITPENAVAYQYVIKNAGNCDFAVEERYQGIIGEAGGIGRCRTLADARRIARFALQRPERTAVIIFDYSALMGRAQ